MNETEMQEKVVIITLNYNQNKFTFDCICSILNSDYINYEILLIENGSTVENVLELENQLPDDPRVHLFKVSPNRGYVGGINYGLLEGMKLNPKYFIIMNNDLLIDKVAISSLVQCCKTHSDFAIVAGKVYDFTNRNTLQTVGRKYKNVKRLTFVDLAANIADSGQFDSELEMDSIDDIFWLIPAKLISQIGIYCDYFWFSSEQLDFALRAKKIGYKLIYTPASKVWHKGSASIGGRDYNPAFAFWHVQSSLILRFRNLAKTDFVVSYLSTLFEIGATLIKSFCLLFFGINRTKYAFAKLLGFISFQSWLISKRPNSGKNPFLQ